MLEPPSSLSRVSSPTSVHTHLIALRSLVFLQLLKRTLNLFFPFSFDDPMRLPNQTKTTFKLLEKQMLFKPFL